MNEVSAELEADASLPMANAHDAPLPVVALVGRPNVGKSTIFNALTQTRDALVYDQPGVTRDRQYGLSSLGERPFTVMDTGGLSDDSDQTAGHINKQIDVALVEADLIVFILDARDGVLPDDIRLLDMLRRTQKPFMTVVNKMDGTDKHEMLAEFSRLGQTNLLMISAIHRRGMGELLKHIQTMLPDETLADTASHVDDGSLRLAIIGRPNVGKSTLVNRLLGEERVIAQDMPGTTRDSIEVGFERDGRTYRLIDTAGIRRRARVRETVEKFSVLKSLESISRAQIVVVMFDANESVTEQDVTVLSHALNAGRGLVVVMNKWDGLEADDRKQILNDLDRKLRFVAHAPIVTISALHGSGLRELMAAIHRVDESMKQEISTSQWTRALEAAVHALPPPAVAHYSPKLRYAHSGGSLPPTVIVHGNRVKKLPDSYKRYLDNFFRKRFKLFGVPLKLIFKEGGNPYAGRKNPLTERQIRRKRRLMKHVKRKK